MALTSTTKAGSSGDVRRQSNIRRPPSGLRTDLTVTAGSFARSGEEESRCVPDGGTAENAGVTWERVDAEDGGLRACPSVDRSATPRLLKLDTETPGG
jgi:assimilatory nitrate reductase catalytic subunit